jgi:hypothetical protein
LLLLLENKMLVIGFGVALPCLFGCYRRRRRRRIGLSKTEIDAMNECRIIENIL